MSSRCPLPSRVCLYWWQRRRHFPFPQCPSTGIYIPWSFPPKRRSKGNMPSSAESSQLSGPLVHKRPLLVMHWSKGGLWNVYWMDLERSTSLTQCLRRSSQPGRRHCHRQLQLTCGKPCRWCQSTAWEFTGRSLDGCDEVKRQLYLLTGVDLMALIISTPFYTPLP